MLPSIQMDSMSDDNISDSGTMVPRMDFNTDDTDDIDGASRLDAPGHSSVEL